MKIENKAKIKKAALFIAIALIFIVVFLLVFYFINPFKGVNKKFFEIIPYPVALVDGDIITTRRLLSEESSLKKFYEIQDFSKVGLRIDFKTESGRERLKIKEKEIFNKIVENILIEKIANSKNIVTTKDEAENELVNKAEEMGNTENLALNLRKLYDWSLRDFRDKVILPRLYLSKLIDYYENEVSKNDKENSKIKTAYQKLNEKKSNFEEISKEYSEGETAKEGGLLGWFKKEHLAKNIAEKAYSMQPGEFSEIIRTPLGSHIIYLDEVKGEGGDKEVKLKQIFTEEGSFLNWLKKEKSEYNVKIFARDFFWDKEALRIKFSDSSMEEKEQELRNNSNGDPSL
jgi:hypothetical protein